MNIDEQQKEIYKLCLPLKVIVPKIEYWDIKSWEMYEIASSHNFCNIAYYINSNESRSRLECWCGVCGVVVKKYIKSYQLKDFVENAVKNKIWFDDYHSLNKLCNDIVMMGALGETGY